MKSSSGFRGVRTSSDSIKRRLRAAVVATPAVAAVLALMPTASRAADLYWDMNGATDGSSANTTAAGTWNATNTNWSTDAAGASATQAWGGAGNTAIFAAGTNATGSYTVTVSGTQAVDRIVVEEGGTVTLNGGTLNLTGATPSIGLSLDNTANNLTINSNITGSGGLLINGGIATGAAGTLTLSGAKSYTGITTIGTSQTTTAGTLVVVANNNNSLGASGPGNEVIFADGGGNAAQTYSTRARLQLNNGVNITKDIRLTGGGARDTLGQLTTATNATATWTGNVNIHGSTNSSGGGGAFNGLASFGAAEGGRLVINGALVSRAGDTAGTAGAWVGKGGRGTVALTQPSPNFVGSIRILDGALEIQADGAMGVAANDGDVDGNPLMNSQAVTGQPNTSPQLWFRAPASSPGGFGYAVGNAPGTGTYKVVTTAAPTGFGGFTSTGLPIIDNKGGHNNFGGALRISGTQPGGAGTPVLFSIGVSVDSLELSGRLYASAANPDLRNIYKVGAGELIISGNNDGTDGVTTGFGQWAMGGLFIINDGTLTLRSADPAKGTLKGNATSAFNFLVNPGATFKLDNSLAVNTDRIASNATITLVGGEAKLIGNAAQPVNQAGGALSVGSYSTLTVEQPATTNGSTTTLSLGTLNRSNRGTALLRGIDNVGGRMQLSGTLVGGAGSGPSVSILPPVVGDASASGDGTDFVTIDGTTTDGVTTGFARPLTASEYTPLAGKVGASDTVNTTVSGGDVAVTSNTSVNSVKLTGGNNVTISPGQRLLVKSGALLGVGGGTSTISGGTLSFEDATVFTDPDTGETAIQVLSVAEGIITVPSGSNLAISSVLAGGEGITKSGKGVLTLSGSNTYGHLATGATTINAGVLEINSDANLGNASTSIVINGGTLRSLATHQTSRAIQLSERGANGLDVAAGTTYTASGLITGGKLIKGGAGTLILANNGNTYSGGTVIEDGFILAGTDGALPQMGSGAVTLAGGTLKVDDDLTLTRSIVATGTNTTGGFLIAAGKTLNYGGGATQAIGISGTGNIAIDGGGKLVLANVSGAQFTHGGRYYVHNGSTLEYRANDAATPNTIAGLGGPPGGTLWTLNDGSTLRFTVSSTSLSGFGGAAAGIHFGPGGGIVDITGTNTLNTQASLSGAGTFTKTGTGTLSIRGREVGGNSGFSGNIVIAGGVVSTSNQGVVLTGDNAETLLGTGTDASTGTHFMKIAGGAEFVPLFNSINMTLNSGRSIRLLDGTPILGSGASGVFRVDGVISSEPGVTGLQIDGQGTTTANAGFVVFGGQNTYAGDTIIKTVAAAGGTGGLRMGTANALPSGTTVRFDAQAASRFAILDLGISGAPGFDQTVAGIVNDGTLGTARITNSGNGAAAILTVNNAAANNFTGEIVGNVGITHGGAGDLVLAGPTTYSGATTASGAGKLVLNNSLPNTAALSALNTATIELPSNGSKMKVIKTGPVTIASGAKIDLADNKLITTSPVGTATTVVGNTRAYDGLQGEVQRAKNGDLWNGNGLTSSVAATEGGLTTIGIANGAQAKGGIGESETAVWGGQTITGSSILAMYTYAGDANLDGAITGDDYSAIDFGILFEGMDGYANGDFNYDGYVTGDDYSVIDLNILLQGPQIPTGGVALGEASAAGLAGVTAVPEPASLSVVALGAFGLLGRRQRRK